MSTANSAAFAVFLAVCAAAQDHAATTRPQRERAAMYPPLAQFVAARQAEFARIDEQRKAELEELSEYVRKTRAADKPVRLLFVCTHNSRRSHLAQLWSAVAAEVYGVRVTTYSGGTEATAFNPRAVAVLQRVGFRIERTSDGENPVYHVRFSDDRPALTCFSKKYDNAPNPGTGFAAVMVCGEADRACPTVSGAAGRFALPYVDPKIADGTPQEAAAYDERCAQIAREMLYLMSRVGRE